MPRGFQVLQQAEAVDLTDPQSLHVHSQRTTKHNQSRGFHQTNRRSNADGLCQSDRSRQKRRVSTETCNKPRSARKTSLIPESNDAHGFRWLDTKNDTFQELNIAGKGVKSRPKLDFVSPPSQTQLMFPQNPLFLPEIALVKPFLVTAQKDFVEEKGRRRKRMHSSEEITPLVLEKNDDDSDDNMKQNTTDWNGRKVIEKDCNSNKIFIKVFLPKIT